MGRRKRRPTSNSSNGQQEPQFDDPRENWLSFHRLQAEQPNIKIPPNILGDADASLWALEHDFYVAPLLNAAAWKEYADAISYCQEFGDDPTSVYRPQCTIPIGWLAEFPKLTDWLIGYVVGLPRIDPVTDHTVVLDWEALAAWKSDVEVAYERLPRHEQRLFRLIRAGFTLTEIAKINHWPLYGTLIPRVRALSQHLRAALKMQNWPDETLNASYYQWNSADGEILSAKPHHYSSPTNDPTSPPTDEG